MIKFVTSTWQREEYRYIVVGIWNTSFGLAVLIILKLTEIPPLTTMEAVSISSSLGMIQSYITQRKFVWQSKNSIKKEFLRFIIVASGQVTSGIILMKFFVDNEKFPLIPTQITITFSLVVVSYLLLRSWTFAPQQNKNE